MRLSVKELTADMVLLAVEESKHDTMLQMLSPGDVDWRNVRTVRHGCEMPLTVRGVQYMFRLADENGQTAFLETLVRVLTPPAAPALLGIGRNLCIFWDNSVPRGMPTEVAASVVEQSGLQYIASWRREYGRVATGARSRPPPRPRGVPIAPAVEPEQDGSIELRRHDLAGDKHSLVLLAAFPLLQGDTDYCITLRTISTGEDLDEREGEGETFQSAESPAVRWFTGLNPPTPLSRIGASNEMTLKLPIEVDACSVLATLGVKSQQFVEGQVEGTDVFQRLQTHVGKCPLPDGDIVSLLGIPADARCGIRVRCAMDLRLLGAERFFWDTSAVLEVETVPNPPCFCGTAFDEKILRPSLLVSWPPRAPSTLSREPQVGATYQVQIYSQSTGTYVTFASTSSSSIDLLDRDHHGKGRTASENREIPDLKPGVCVCVRLLRAPSNPASLSLPSHQAATAVLLAPLPPDVALRPGDDSKNDVVRVSWDGALDVDHLPESMSPLPFEIALQAASGPVSCRICKNSNDARLQASFREYVGRLAQSKSPGLAPVGTFQTIATSRGASGITASLAQGLRYQFRLCVTTSCGVATSSTVEVCTKPTVPKAPSSVVGSTAYFISAAGHRAPFLRLVWDAPLSYGAPVDRYLVQVRHSSAAPGTWGLWHSIYAGPQVSCGDNATLHQQNILAQYRVKAGSSVGWSSYSSILTVDAPSGLEAWHTHSTDGSGIAFKDPLKSEVGYIDGVKLSICPTHKNTPDILDTTFQIRKHSEIPPALSGAIAEVRWPSEHRSSTAAAVESADPLRSKLVQSEVVYRAEDLLGYPVTTAVLRRALLSLQASSAHGPGESAFLC